MTFDRITFRSFGDQITAELKFIRILATLAGIGALMNQETGAALLAIPLFLLVGTLDRIFRHPAIV